MPYRTHIHITHLCMDDQNVYKSLAAENLFETLTGNIVSIFNYSDLIKSKIFYANRSNVQ